MIGYVTLGTNDFERAAQFYDTVLACLGAGRLIETQRTIHYGKAGRPGTLALIRPYDGHPASVGNGVMFALATRTKELVEHTYRTALAHGATDEGAPGVRSENFYGAYFRDLDGNKLCVFTMTGPVAPDAIRKLHDQQVGNG